MILEFDSETNSGKIQSLTNGEIYSIDFRELVRTRIKLSQGDKILFAPFEDPEGSYFARVIRIVALNALSCSELQFQASLS